MELYGKVIIIESIDLIRIRVTNLNGELKIINVGVNKQQPAYVAYSKTGVNLYMANSASSVRFLPLTQEANDAYTTPGIIGGSAGDGSCTVGGTCNGDRDGFSTYAKFDTIAGITISYEGTADKYVFVHDIGNNKIKRIDVTTLLVETFDSNFANNLDNDGLPSGGIVVDTVNNFLFAAQIGGIWRYDLSLGTLALQVASKTAYIGAHALAMAPVSTSE